MSHEFAHHRSGYTQPEDASILADRSEIGPLVKRSMVAMEGLSAQWRRGLTINAHERMAIMHLWESGPMTMSELGDRIPLSRAAITALTDRLERMNYVVRTPDKQDRRRTMLSITARPFDVLMPLMAPFAGELNELVDGFDDVEWAAVTRFLSSLHERAHDNARRLRRLNDDELHELVETGQRGALVSIPL